MGDECNDKLTLVRASIVEFIGDTLFVFIGSVSGLAGGNVGTLAPAFAHGFTIFLLIASMGHISGGHFNPAVTLGVLISGNISIFGAVAYVVSQLGGGIFGSLLVKAAFSNETDYEAVAGLTLPNPKVGIDSMIVCELVLTYILVSTVLNGAVDKVGNSPVAPLAIGSAVFVDIIAGGAVSGASMNPARSLGPAIVYSIFGQRPDLPWNHHYIYWIGPPLGAVLAALVYKSILAEPTSRWIGRSGAVIGPDNGQVVDIKHGH